jgi:hypothetical protein
MSQPTTSILLNSTSPAAPAGNQNVKPQTDGATPLQSITMYPQQATNALLGVSKPDGTTITIDPTTGKLSAALPAGMATQAGVQQETYTGSADTGTANAYVVTQSPVPTIVEFSSITFKAANACTGPSTITWNGTTYPLTKNGTAPLVLGDIQAGQIVHGTADGAGNVQIGGVPSATLSPVLFVQGASQVAPGSGNNVKAFAANNTAGNCIIVDVVMPMGNAFTSALTVTDTQGNTYTLVTNQSPGLDVIFACWVAYNCAGGANTVTLNVATGGFGSRPFFTGMAIHEYTGVASASALDVFTQNLSGTGISGGQALPLSLTTTVAGDLLHAFAGDENGFVETYTNTTGWPQRELLPFTSGSGNWPQMATFDSVVGAAGSYSNTLEVTSTPTVTLPAAIMIALKAKPTGVGSLTSISATVPAFLTVAVTNPTSAAAIAITATSEAANLVLASPNGASGPMTPRALVPADVPVFVASGSGHAAGAVPDPGATAGTTKFLREDATFAVPPGSGGISLTTIGSSGAATLVGTTLNIPTPSGGGGGGGGATLAGVLTITPPNPSSYTLSGSDSAGTTTSYVAGQSFALTLAAGSSNHSALRYAALPSSPIGIYCAAAVCADSTTGSDFSIFLLDGSQATLRHIRVTMVGGVWRFGVSSATGDLSTATANIPFSLAVTFFFRIFDNGSSTRFYQYSFDMGNSWYTFFSEARTAISTPVSYGWQLANSSTSNTCGASIWTLYTA